MKFAIALALAAPIACIAPQAAFAQSDDEMAKQMVNDPNPSTLNVYGVTPAPKSVKDDSVQGGRAMKVKVPGGGNPYDVGAASAITKPIRAGDKIVVMFYAKLDKPEPGQTGTINAAVQLAKAPYSSFMTKPFTLTGEWQLFSFEGKADRNYAAGEVNASFQLNTAKQTVALGIVAVFDKGQ